MARPIPLFLLVFLALPAYAAPQTYVQFSSGTGFFINPEGHLITNEHVVRGCRSLEVRTASGVLPASILATDETRDLAVLKTPAPPPAIAPLRWNIDSLQPGDAVALYGFPGPAGANGTPSYARTTLLGLHGPQGEPAWLQLASVAQQGNSGGPVLDASGHVIAVLAGHADTYKNPTTTDGKSEFIGRTDIAVTLSALQEFLGSNHIPFYRAASGMVTYGDDMLAETSRKFIAPVRCIHGVVTRG